MNVYDFDETIYKKDSTIKFYFFCLRKNILLLRYIFVQLFYYIKFVFGFTNKTGFKQGFFCFLRGIKNVDLLVEQFWAKNERDINEWYLTQKKESDVVISASPEFLIAPICKKIGIKSIIGSRVDKRTGKFMSENCYGEEKVKRFTEKYNDLEINEFYSDSTSDKYLAEIAKSAFIVKKNGIIPWNDYKQSSMSKLKKMFLSTEFIGFLIIGGINAINGVLFAMLFELWFNANVAFIVGYMCSLTISYLLNSFLVFKHKLSILKYIKFCISYIPNFLIQNGIVLLFYNVLGINRIIVYILAVTVSVPITFIVLKLFAFSRKKSKQK